MLAIAPMGRSLSIFQTCARKAGARLAVAAALERTTKLTFCRKNMHLHLCDWLVDRHMLRGRILLPDRSGHSDHGHPVALRLGIIFEADALADGILVRPKRRANDSSTIATGADFKVSCASNERPRMSGMPIARK
jgi:hypothetical protein